MFPSGRAPPWHAARPYLSCVAGRSPRGVTLVSSVQRGCAPRLVCLARLHAPHCSAFPGVGGISGTETSATVGRPAAEDSKTLAAPRRLAYYRPGKWWNRCVGAAGVYDGDHPAVRCLRLAGIRCGACVPGGFGAHFLFPLSAKGGEASRSVEDRTR